MEERKVRAIVEEMLTGLDPEFGYKVHHEQFTADMPQSGERLNRQNLRAMQQHYPNPPTFTLRRLVGAGDVWVVEALGDYSGKLYHLVAIIEFRDGKSWKETRYYAEPFEPPAWRAQWVEPIQQPQTSPVRQLERAQEADLQLSPPRGASRQPGVSARAHSRAGRQAGTSVPHEQRETHPCPS